MNLHELAEEVGVDAEPLVEAVASAQRARQARESRKNLIASAEPAECMHRQQQARKAVAALPLRAKASLHWALAERLALTLDLTREQTRALMEGESFVDAILAALVEPVEPEEPDRELQWLIQAWTEAGGQLVETGRYDCDLIDFLLIAYRQLGDTPTEDAIRLRLDRIRRSPPDSEG